MGVHAGVQRRLFVFGKGVGRHGDDGNALCVLPLQSADGPRGLVAVHHRHLHIHQDGVEFARLRPPETLHR